MKWLNPDTMKFYTGPKKSPETMEADGFLPYHGTLPAERLAVTYEGEFAVIEELPEPPATEEWVSTKDFIHALASLITAEQLSAMMQDPDALKNGLIGLAQLPSDMVDLLDPRVEPWLIMTGLTVDQVRKALP